jgi:hypothetical protein
MLKSDIFMRSISLVFAGIAMIGAKSLLVPAAGDCRLQIQHVGGYYIGSCIGDCSTYAAPYNFCATVTTTDGSTFTEWKCVCANRANNPTGHVDAAKACNATLRVDGAGRNPTWECWIDNPDLCPATTPPPSQKCIKQLPVGLAWTDACTCKIP